MADDFQGSIAQEDVQYITEIVTEVAVGDNYSKLMIFIEQDKYILDDSSFAEVAPGIELAPVAASNYALVAQGKLRTWLDDFFAAQQSATVYLVTFTPDLTEAVDWTPAEEALLSTAFELLKARAYWKTILVTVTATDALIPASAAALAGFCGADPLLSSPALLPYSTATPETVASDPIYVAVEAEAAGSSFLVCHYDDERNGSLIALSLALGVTNGSGTSVGNSFDFVSTGVIDASGAAGTELSVATQAILKAANISYFKPIGDTTGRVALIGAKELDGSVVPAGWIVKFCNYVNKVNTAKYITKMNTYRNNNVYQGILLILSTTVNRFTEKSGSGRLSNFSVTAPPFTSLPVTGDTIVVPNAWKAKYQDNVREVQVYGQLTLTV